MGGHHEALSARLHAGFKREGQEVCGDDYCSLSRATAPKRLESYLVKQDRRWAVTTTSAHNE